jgi:hypothetical protein
MFVAHPLFSPILRYLSMLCHYLILKITSGFGCFKSFRIKESLGRVFQGKIRIRELSVISYFRNIKELRVFMKELAQKNWQLKRWVSENLKVFFLFENQSFYTKTSFLKNNSPLLGPSEYIPEMITGGYL